MLNSVLTAILCEFQILVVNQGKMKNATVASRFVLGDCDNTVNCIFPVYGHIFLPRQVVLGCRPLIVPRNILCSEEIFGREMRKRLYGQG